MFVYHRQIISISLIIILAVGTHSDQKCNKTELQTIDLHDFLSGNESMQNAIAEIFDFAMRNHGFVYFTNTECDKFTVDSLYNAILQFFDNPIDTKLKYQMGDFGSQGYIPYGTQKTNEAEFADEYSNPYKIGDLVETYDIKNIGHDWYLTSPSWDDIPNEFKQQNVLKNYINKLHSISSKLNYLASYSLGLKTNEFEMKTRQQMNGVPYHWLTINHYFDIKDKNITKYSARRGAHTDWNGFTILYIDQECGLQARINDEWIDIPYKNNSFVVNAGDVIQRWTNDRWIAAKHRVIPCTDKRRISFSLFTGPNYEELYLPLSGCKKCTKTVGQHVRMKYETSQTSGIEQDK